MFRIIFSILFAAVLLQSCYNDKSDKLYPTPTTGGGGGGCDTANVSFSGFVSGVMTSKCGTPGCHDAGTAARGFVLDNYNGIKACATSGRMIGAISHASGFIAMPQGSPKLDDCTIAKISAWVAKGAPNN